MLMVAPWMLAKSSADVTRLSGSWSFPENTHQPTWLSAQAMVTSSLLPAFIRGPMASKRCDTWHNGG